MEEVEGDKEMINCDVVNNSEICQCNELKERSAKAEARCAELELELEKRKKYCEALEAKLNALEEEKSATDDKLKFFSISSEGLRGNQLSSEREQEKKNYVDLEKDNQGEDKVFQLTVEIRVLEYEKKKAESEVQVWKERFKKLESRALEMGLKWPYSDCHDENGNQGSVLVKPEGQSLLGTSLNFMQNQGKVVNLGDVVSCNLLSAAGNPSNEMYQRNLLHSEARPDRRTRRRLALESGQSPSNKMAPSTPMGAKPASTSVVDIIDSDDEPNIIQQPMLHNQDGGSISFSTCFAAAEEKLSDNSLKGNLYVGKNEDLNFGSDVPFISTPKRKRACNVVSSESESDDDNVPICKLKRMHILEGSPDYVRCDLNDSVTATPSVDDKVGTATPRRRLVPLRKCVIKSQEDKRSSTGPSEDKHEQSVPTNDEANDDELEEVSSGVEEESLSNFIVNDSDVSDCEDTSSKSVDASDGEADSHSQDASDRDLNFSEILSRIQRNKDQNMKWEFEADMLAAFGKDPQLCMKAICTLYRQQTSEEQRSKGSMFYNGRGFSKFDALRGSTLAEFLTDGDPRGDLKKSVKELEEYDRKAVEHCRTMATRYSKQLFEIYKNKEDPFFP